MTYGQGSWSETSLCSTLPTACAVCICNGRIQVSTVVPCLDSYVKYSSVHQLTHNVNVHGTSDVQGRLCGACSMHTMDACSKEIPYDHGSFSQTQGPTSRLHRANTAFAEAPAALLAKELEKLCHRGKETASEPATKISGAYVANACSAIGLSRWHSHAFYAHR